MSEQDLQAFLDQPVWKLMSVAIDSYHDNQSDPVFIQLFKDGITYDIVIDVKESETQVEHRH